MKTLKIIFLFSAFIFLILQIAYYEYLPDTIATHFTANGVPNGWMPKTASLIISFIAEAIILFVFLIVEYLLKIVPPEMINVPHKDYWLTPENKGTLLRIITSHIYVIGIATNLFFVFLFYEMYRFNVHTNDGISMIAIVPFIIIIVGTGINMILRLMRCE
jgi:uncharacterized membrane protein